MRAARSTWAVFVCGADGWSVVLTWISDYWFSRSGPAASVRIYYEVTQASEYYVPWSSVPCGLSYFPKELTSLPKTCVFPHYPLLFLADEQGCIQVGSAGRERRVRV